MVAFMSAALGVFFQASAEEHLDATVVILYLLGTLVRDKQMLSLEDAIHKLTSVPAQVFGVPLRGTLAAGNIADVVVFDPDTVNCGKQEPVNDFPGGGLRYIEKSTGITHTILNGQVLFSDGEQTGPLSGRVLRSNVEQ